MISWGSLGVRAVLFFSFAGAVCVQFSRFSNPFGGWWVTGAGDEWNLALFL